MEHFDLVVIGAGPAGYAAAMRAMDFKKKVLLIERDNVGGAGVTNGALSSKSWWEMSRRVSAFRKSLKKYAMPEPKAMWDEVQADVRSAVGDRKKLLEFHLECLENSHYRGLLTFIKGEGKVIEQNVVRVTNTEGEHLFQTDYIILATGSRPRYLPELPIDEQIVMTSDGIENMTDFPKSMVIVGAGVIGCEFATIFAGFGQTHVNLIDKGDRILPFEDEDVVSVIEKNLEKQGVNIHRNSRLVKLEVINGRVVYELEYTDGHKETFEVEKALVSVGRVPNFENLVDPKVGVEINNRGIVDDDTQTNISNIFAVGDITADISLVNVGELEGRYAVERMFGKPERKLIYENISTIMFLNPEVAGVGLNEVQAREKGIDYKVVSLDYACIPRAIAKRDTSGFIKILVSNDDEMKLLGMRVVGYQSSAAIQAIALLISMGKGIEELAECVHPHPSITEGVQECVRMLLGKSTLKAGVMNDMLSCKCWSCELNTYDAVYF